ncbi:MAG: DUF3536 domain-containing protein [Desulfatiglandales bacterium]
MQRYICIHGHFYQPPRENPWIEAVDLQDSAYPYHDWNRRVTAECYAPNAKSRILDDRNRIVEIVNNYAKISFNFGPTLLAWMEENAPLVYEAVLEADKQSRERFSGHGSALAQAYNHMILPLANRRDKITQILWGMRDFTHRFQRRPEGMWLPETAVDLETLEILANQGVAFTILAQHQAARIRPLGEKTWEDMKGGKIDPTRAYQISLPSGDTMALFFYDGAISRAVAFEKLLSSGENFVQRLLGGFSDGRTWPQLLHVATDGESYGHHHRFGDMALAYALKHIETKNLARLTNYGQYLEEHPPTHEVEIQENTSWSCAHGVERWRSDCGCRIGTHPGGNQKWREHLRGALDRLRDIVAPVYEKEARRYLKDPWEARNGYIACLLRRSPETIRLFLKKYGVHGLREADRQTALKLLELQRHAMLMYTSCGWFFDDLSGIETIQILQYAGRVLQLAGEVLGCDFETSFLDILVRAKSNMPDRPDGRQIYEAFVEPAVADLKRVAAHYAMSSLFKEYEEQCTIFCYDVNREDYRISRSGKAGLVLGRAGFTSQITGDSARLSFGVLHLGDHNMTCGVREFRGEEEYQHLIERLSEIFIHGDIPETIRSLDNHFGPSPFSLRSLFRDEQRRILDLIMEPALQEAEKTYRQLYETHIPMIRFLKNSNSPLPGALSLAAEFVVNAELKRALKRHPLEPERVRELLEEAISTGSSLEKETLEYGLRKSLEAMGKVWEKDPKNIALLDELDAALTLLDDFPVQVNLWTVQNICYHICQSIYPDQVMSADAGDDHSGRWIRRFFSLAERLQVSVPDKP